MFEDILASIHFYSYIFRLAPCLSIYLLIFTCKENRTYFQANCLVSDDISSPTVQSSGCSGTQGEIWKAVKEYATCVKCYQGSLGHCSNVCLPYSLEKIP